VNERAGRDEPDKKDMKFEQKVHLKKKRRKLVKNGNSQSFKKEKNGKRELHLTATDRNRWTKLIGSMRTISFMNFPMMVLKTGEKNTPAEVMS